MSGTLWGVTLALAITLAAVVYVLGNRPKPSQQTLVSPVVSPTVQATLTASGTVMPSSSRYVSYSKAAYDEAADKKRILYFHATWCPICTVVNEELTEKADQIPSDLVVFKTDYDIERELKTTYGVTYQHTFVQVDGAGNKVTAWNGGGIDELRKNIK